MWQKRKNNYILVQFCFAKRPLKKSNRVLHARSRRCRSPWPGAPPFARLNSASQRMGEGGVLLGRRRGAGSAPASAGRRSGAAARLARGVAAAWPAQGVASALPAHGEARWSYCLWPGGLGPHAGALELHQLGRQSMATTVGGGPACKARRKRVCGGATDYVRFRLAAELRMVQRQ